MLSHIDPTPFGYSSAVIVHGPLAFVSGQIPLNEKGELVGAGDFEAQAGQVFSNLSAMLVRLGAQASDIVKATYFVVALDAERLRVVRELRAALFEGAHPAAATLIGVEALYAPEALIEIELVVAISAQALTDTRA